MRTVREVRPKGGAAHLRGTPGVLAALPLILALSAGAAPAPREAAGPAPAFRDAAPRHHDPSVNACSDCHVVGAGAGEGRGDHLLRFADPLDLCLSCHDGRAGIPDVLGSDVNGLADRAAGCFRAVDAPDGRGHPLGHGPGGRSGADRVTCIDCHDPHGNRVGRNLRAGGGAVPLGLFTDPRAAGLDRYESARVAFGTLDDDRLREVSMLCLGCHPDHGDARAASGDGIRHGHHPVYDSGRGEPNTIAGGAPAGRTDPRHWESGAGAGFGRVGRVPVIVRGATGYAAACAVEADRNGVFCLSCHKAHGSCQPFGLLWPIRAGAPETGCEQCHHVTRDGPAVAGGTPGAAAARGGSTTPPSRLPS